jgi:hypothetical protein
VPADLRLAFSKPRKLPIDELSLERAAIRGRKRIEGKTESRWWQWLNMTLDQKLDGIGIAIHRGYRDVVVLGQRWQPENKSKKEEIVHVQHSDL